MAFVNGSQFLFWYKTYGPLNTEQSKQERKSIVPTSSLIDNPFRAEYVASRMHLMTRGCREKNDDNDL